MSEHARPVVEPLTDGDPRLVGGFRICGRLGTGSMGRVYLGCSPAGRPVAVKVIRPDLAEDSQFRRRFRREVNLVRTVHSLYTAALIDADPEATQPWLAVTYIPGPSLRDAIHINGPLPAGSLYKLAAGVAEALVAIHAAGIIHRDLKPANVLLADDGPRVIDFGIARTADASHLTATGISIGTPSFMAPEEVLGHPVGPPADVFALGALLTYAATGRPPFGDGPTDAVMYRIIHEPPDLVGLDNSLRSLIEACLHKDPKQRPTPAEILWACQSHTDQYGSTSSWLPETLTVEITRCADFSIALNCTGYQRRLRHRIRIDVAIYVTISVLIGSGAVILWPPVTSGGGAGPTFVNPSPSVTATLPGPLPASTTVPKPDILLPGPPTLTPSFPTGQPSTTTTQPITTTTQPTTTTTQPTTTTTQPTTTTTQPPSVRIFGVGVNADPRLDTVSCGPEDTVVFTASVAAQGSGTITFVWRPDDRIAAPQRQGSMTFTGTQEQHTQFSVPRTGEAGQRLQGSVIFEIISPADQHQIVGDQFDLTCQ